MALYFVSERCTPHVASGQSPVEKDWQLSWYGFDSLRRRILILIRITFSMQRRIMGKHFFPFFAENIKKYRNKLPVLKPIEKDLVEDMRLFLIENLWLPDDSGSFKLAVIENVSYDRAMALFGKPRQKKFTVLIMVKYRTYCGKWTNRHSYQPDIG